ncbi:nuclear transport factor 2 family protein [Delftia sp. RIT313]|uniref:nuclear transport factor 2 family protein n=1 Tax=Delftia sp. RIT313 TaxID=1468410 RepID=UPI00044D6B37|nr:nuclear transport factor 2 family protein [Delftia sp. RIT313]EZP56041.1 hypothetical protein BW39_01843 [Delftia sp. RIT313]
MHPRHVPSPPPQPSDAAHCPVLGARTSAQVTTPGVHGGDDRLLQHLQALEVRLHDPQVRSDAGQLQALLHEDFLEFGRSGGVHDRAATVDSLAAALPAGPPARLVSGGFALARLGPDSALLTYRSASVAEDGTAGRHTLRSSVWLRTALGWQMRFHQGTPTAPFDLAASMP